MESLILSEPCRYDLTTSRKLEVMTSSRRVAGAAWAAVAVTYSCGRGLSRPCMVLWITL